MKDLMEEFLRRANAEVLPMMERAAISAMIWNEKPDAKLCVEFGAAVLFGKPIILVVPEGRALPERLRRLADAVVEGDLKSPEVGQQLQDAISEVVAQLDRGKADA